MDGESHGFVTRNRGCKHYFYSNRDFHKTLLEDEGVGKCGINIQVNFTFQNDD